MKIQVLHERDPDNECGVRVWIDGVEHKDIELEDIDPGRGYTRADWDERITTAEEQVGTSTFHAAVVTALVGNQDSPHIRDEQ